MQLTPTLALLLTHDLLLSKSGVAANANHVLKLAILRNKARLSAEFTKARIRHGHATVEAFREAVNNGELEEGEVLKPTLRHPRWVRVNTLQTTLADQLATTFKGFEKASEFSDVQRASGSAKIYYEDDHIPNLLALPPKIDLSKKPAYVKGEIILQDKASCFPAYLLDVKPEDGDSIDGCAAPGNKTTHLAAIVSEQNEGSDQHIFAFERDKVRAVTLQKMVKRASADKIVSIKAAADFLAAKPDSEEFANVGGILLDPSCSGSGIVGRDDAIKMHLPVSTVKNDAGSKNKKRKRDDGARQENEAVTTVSLGADDTTPEETPIEDNKLAERLTSLSTFQLRILTHAMRFPRARKITYSTCSIHFEENEGVVFQALASAVAKENGWRILPREQQVQGMKSWARRGVWEDEKLDNLAGLDDTYKEEVCNSCIRCEKGTEEGTMGFFVAAFVRDLDAGQGSGLHGGADAVMQEVEEDEWNGFSDDEKVEAAVAKEPVNNGTSKPSKSKKKKQRR